MVCYTINLLGGSWSELDQRYLLSCLELLQIGILELGLVKDKLINDLFLELSVNLLSNLQIQELNKNYRHKNTPTNVLSFPIKEILEGNYYLGDICLAYEFIKEESIKQNKSFCNHFAHLLCHGLLHLLGYTHDNQDDTAIMINYEVKLLLLLNINNPYTQE